MLVARLRARGREQSVNRGPPPRRIDSKSSRLPSACVQWITYHNCCIVSRLAPVACCGSSLFAKCASDRLRVCPKRGQPVGRNQSQRRRPRSTAERCAAKRRFVRRSRLAGRKLSGVRVHLAGSHPSTLQARSQAETLAQVQAGSRAMFRDCREPRKWIRRASQS